MLIALAGVLLIALFACSILGTAAGLPWVSWAAAVAAAVVVAAGLFMTDRRSSAVVADN